MQKKNSAMDMIHGPLLKNIFLFAPPLMLSNLLQRLFNAADTLVVGRFCGPEALAAVGAAAPVVVLLVWGLNGLSVGADVVIANMYGRRDEAGISRAVHGIYFIALAAGGLNILLNLLFVLLLHMGVAGVAVGTVISQLTAAVLVTRALLSRRAADRLELRRIHADRTILRRVLSIGIPASVQSMMFSVSNIIVQSSINTLGSVAIAANSAALTIEDFVYVTTSAFNQACITFTGQNAGAGNLSRIRRILAVTVVLVTCSGFLTGYIGFRLGHSLLGLFTAEEPVITAGLLRLRLVAMPLFLNGVLDSFVASMRGMGYSTLPTMVTLTGICGTRLLYILTVFAAHRSLEALYFCFPLSWFITLLLQILLWSVLFRRFCRRV